MSQPTPGDVYVNRPLTSFSTMIAPKLSKFKADQLAPVTPCENQDVMWYEFPKSYWWRDGMRLRAPGTRAVLTGYKLATRTAHIDVWALAHGIADQTRSNTSQTPIQLDRNATRLLTIAALMNREKSWAANFLVTGVWSTTLVGVAVGPTAGQFLQWNDAASTPIDDVEDAKAAMEAISGYEGNVLVMGKAVWRTLKSNAQILGRVAGGSTTRDPQLVTKELIARLFEVDELVVLEAIENTAAEVAPELVTLAAPNFTGTFIAGKAALLYYRDADGALDLESAQAMRTMTWRSYIANASGVRIKKFREEPIEQDTVEIQSAYKHVVVAKDLGVLFASVIA